MTENKNQNTTYDDSEAYLYEPFTTEDGIVVPPPTRPMGPRRLIRYRNDAAEYLRALKNGDKLPDEPVAYMGTLENDEVVNTESTAAHQRLSALAAQGSMESAASDEDTLQKVQGNGTAQSTSVQSDPTMVGLDDSSLVFEDEVEPASSAVDESSYQPLTVTTPWATGAQPVVPAPADSEENSVGVDEQVHESEAVVSDPLTQHDGEDASAESISPLESDELGDAGESENFSVAASEPAVDEGVHETEVVEVTDSALFEEEQDAPVEEYIPETVSALSAQGLDLTPVAAEFSEFTDDELLGDDAGAHDAAAPVQEHDSFESVEAESEGAKDSQEYENLREDESLSESQSTGLEISEYTEGNSEQSAGESQFDVAQIGQSTRAENKTAQVAEEPVTPVGYVKDSTEAESHESSSAVDRKSTSAVWLPLVLIIMALVIFGIYFFMNNG